MLRYGNVWVVVLILVTLGPHRAWSEENRTYGSLSLKSGSTLTGWIEETADGTIRVTAETGEIILQKEQVNGIRIKEPPDPTEETADEIRIRKAANNEVYPIARTEEDLVACFKNGDKIVFYKGDCAYLMPDGLYYRDTEAYDLEMHLLHQHLVRFQSVYSAEGRTDLPEVENWRELRRHWEEKTPVVNFRGAQAFYMSNDRYYWSQNDFNFGHYDYMRLKLPEEYFDGRVYPVRYFLEKPKDTSEVERLVDLVRTDFERQVAFDLVKSTNAEHLLNVFLTELNERDHIRYEEEREARKIRSDIENHAPIRHSIFVIGKYVKEYRQPRRFRR